MSQEHAEKFEQWAIVDVMGHQRYVGLVTEQVIAGAGFVRVDIPETEGSSAWTKILGTSSIYSISPVSESIARQLASQRRDRPVESYELPAIESKPSNHHEHDDETIF